MTSYPTDFNDYPAPWKGAWCVECQKYVFVCRDAEKVRQKGLDHDTEVHHPDPFAGPEFRSYSGDDDD